MLNVLTKGRHSTMKLIDCLSVIVLENTYLFYRANFNLFYPRVFLKMKLPKTEIFKRKICERNYQD